MSTEVLEPIKQSETAVLSQDAVKQALLGEAELRLKLAERGIRFVDEEIKKFRAAHGFVRGFEGGRRGDQRSVGFTLPHGITASGSYNAWTPYSLVVEDDSPVLYDDSQRIGEVTFSKANPIVDELLDTKISTGDLFRDVASVNTEGGMAVAYSNECSLKDQGEDCLFCGLNIRAQNGTANKVFVKSPRQIADAYTLARKAGTGNHLRISGGFVPERRELEYYIDVVEAIRDQAGYKDLYVSTIIGAPSDYSIIDKYKEAGVSVLSNNLEVWDKDIFKAICPGKEKRNGGWKHWVESLEYAVGVFGKGNVHSTLVAGLAPKQTTLEGIEYLASKGIICHFSQFRPLPGTPLEGYRSPEASWHWDLILKGAEIYRRYGFSTNQLYAGPASGRPTFDVFRINAGEFVGDQLPHWKFPSLD